MQELAAEGVPTRELNEFETTALARIKEGDQVVAVENSNRIRMFGALRAAESCTQCHSVQRNELLGAFTYEFVKTSSAPADDGSDAAPLL